ncbi:nitrate- and nitrite sensing domain-containing protein [Streptomyces sp. PR69]|uniref:nitrate- and nitrite sensing domain-containing protein n=1 Tax=Streptomyces sp. PR69 TaxID=2984950 RepID=UPI0022645074|nr:nitrate- and nitrite sensing domain-containing protein [Streptomyces sp. PR69]
MQKKRPQDNGGRPEPGVTPDQGGTSPDVADVPVGRGRHVRVRRRLVAGVAVITLAVAGAGAPGVLAAADRLTESQRLATLAALNRQAVTLAHSLADERDDVTVYIAAGREDRSGEESGDNGDSGGERQKASDDHRARVDRQIEEIRGELTGDHEELGRELAALTSVRRTALTGKGSAEDAHRAYTQIIAGLQALAGELADKTPARAAETPRAPAALGRAVEQAGATRGLLLAALAVPREESTPTLDPVTGLPVQSDEPDADDQARDALSAAAQQARVRELAALADFDQAAGKEARDSLAATVSGPEVKAAEGHLARLAGRPALSETDLETNPEDVAAALTARIEQMRGVESSLATDQVERFEELRDDDVTALELRIALLGGVIVLTVGACAAIARTLTRPLAAVRIGAARLADAPAPETAEPVRFTGRNDEFAQVVRSLNTLHGKLRELSARVRRLDGEQAAGVAERVDLARERDALTAELAAARAELQERTGEISAELLRLRRTVKHTFVNLSLRNLGLVDRQLSVIEKLEEREQDPERLATFFKLDHMATVMRRHSENLLVLAGAEHGHGHPGPVPLVDVLRAAVSEIERYERVVIQSVPPHTRVAGFAADDVSHLVAELLENATSFSPPDAGVELSGWLLQNGEVMLSVQDAGIGMTPARMEELNARLADPEPYENGPGDDEGEGLGLRVAALLAARHGVRVQLREHKQGGITAVVVLPQALLPEGQAPVAAAAPAVQLPGSQAEANSNALPTSPRRAVEPRDSREATHERTPDLVDQETVEIRLPEPARAPEPVSESEPGSEPELAPGPLAEADPVPEPEPESSYRLTDKGLPKRVPQSVQTAAADADRTQSVDAEDLRRRLGGFQQGAKDGRRDAAAEIEASAATTATTTTDEAPEEESGDTVEEARS